MRLLDRTGGGPDVRARTPMLRLRDGSRRPLPVHRWVADATELERELLDQVRGPVLDLGCGPGRLVTALGERGVTALGVDTSAHALALARQRGAAVLERSVFDRLPGAGRWRTAILLDGNLGIGGDAGRLLRRTSQLLAPGNSTLVEVDPPGRPTEVRDVRLEVGDRRSHWFPWAFVGADGLGPVAHAGGHRVLDVWSAGERWFARLEPRHRRR